MHKILYLGMFGLLGIYSRYFLDMLVQTQWGQPHFVTTLLVNLLGSFGIGCIFILGAEQNTFSPDFQIGLVVGLLGGFTTFSTFSLDTIRLMETHKVSLATGYVLASVLIGIFSCYGGMLLTRRWLS